MELILKRPLSRGLGRKINVRKNNEGSNDLEKINEEEFEGTVKSSMDFTFLKSKFVTPDLNSSLNNNLDHLFRQLN
jgi:hypothetical protein